MSDIFITSDEHYGHEKIIEYVKRPFSCANECKEAMIERHNETVPDKQGYLTIHAGDMFWPTMTEEYCHEILNRLHGRHAFIWGNHDKVIKQHRSLRSRFAWVQHAEVLHYNKHKLSIFHYAQRVWESSHKGAWHVYGHSHQGLPPLGLSFDIGVEGHDYRPWSLEEIERKMNTLEKHHVIKPENVWPGKEENDGNDPKSS